MVIYVRYNDGVDNGDLHLVNERFIAEDLLRERHRRLFGDVLFYDIPVSHRVRHRLIYTQPHRAHQEERLAADSAGPASQTIQSTPADHAHAEQYQPE